MIASVEMKAGFAAELPNLKGRKFEFTPKCNILFGQNGSGKTTIMKVAAGYTGIETKAKQDGGGWSKPPRIMSFGKKVEFPASFVETTIGGVTADVVWDGMPCFYNSASLSEAGANLGYFVDSAEGSPDGMMDMMEQVSLITGHYSEGELRNHKISKVVKAMQKPPSPWPPTLGEHASDSAKSYAQYVKKLLPKEGGIRTLLWDEPDRSLSVENQILFWTRFIPHFLETGVQIIVATHSYIPMFLPQFSFFNIIDVEKGYYASSKRHFLNLLSVSLDIDEQERKKKEAEKQPEPPKAEEPPKEQPTPKKKGRPQPKRKKK